MAKVIILSRTFPSYHIRKGEPTYFVEKFMASMGYKRNDEEREFEPRLSLDDFEPKNHTIRAGGRWKEGEWFSPRCWSGKPYQSKQIVIDADVLIQKIFDFEIKDNEFFVDGKQLGSLQTVDLAINDGLHTRDLLSWFKFPKPFKGQIICWKKNVTY